jgi:hypothetical protein
MRNLISNFVCVWLGLLLATCGDETSVRQTETSESSPIVITNDAFQYVLHDGVKREQAAQIGDSLLANYPRIMRHLQVASMPRVIISLWSTDHSDEYYAEMRNRIGQVYPGATGYTPTNTDMCLLWNSSTPKSSVHEYAHLVSLALKPNIGNNPRWLWEAVAQFESRTFDHPATWTPAQRSFPGFTALNQYSSDLPYRWGYFLCSCTIDRWGDEAYITMIKSNGNIQSALGITESELGTLAEEYVRHLAGS